MKVRKIVAGLAAVSMLAAFSAEAVFAADTCTIKAGTATAKAGEEFTLEGTELLARAFCHEIDHLNGVVFKEVCERMLTRKEIDKMQG